MRFVGALFFFFFSFFFIFLFSFLFFVFLFRRVMGNWGISGFVQSSIRGQIEQKPRKHDTLWRGSEA